MTNGSEIDPDNVIAPTYDELLEEDRRVFEARINACIEEERRQMLSCKEGLCYMIDQSIGAAIQRNNLELIRNFEHTLLNSRNTDMKDKQPLASDINASPSYDASKVQHEHKPCDASATPLPYVPIQQNTLMQHIHRRTTIGGSASAGAPYFTTPSTAGQGGGGAPFTPPLSNSSNNFVSSAPHATNYHGRVDENSANVLKPSVAKNK